MPYPSPADLGFLAMVPLIVAGMAALLTFRRHTRAYALLDGLIISCSLLFVSWATVLGPAYHTGAENPLELVVTLAYPIGDVVTASNETYTSGNLIDTGWFAGFLLLGLAGLWATAEHRPAEAPATAAERVAPFQVALPYIPLGIAFAASVVIHVTQGRIGPFLYLTGSVLVLLVLVRQLLTLRENLALTRMLETTVDDLRNREEQLHYLAFHDPLTGLANRALFQDRADHAIARQRLRNADIAMYAAKVQGKGRCVTFQPKMRAGIAAPAV